MFISNISATQFCILYDLSDLLTLLRNLLSTSKKPDYKVYIYRKPLTCTQIYHFFFCMTKKSCPFLYRISLYRNGQDFLFIQYCIGCSGTIIENKWIRVRKTLYHFEMYTPNNICNTVMWIRALIVCGSGSTKFNECGSGPDPGQ